MTGFAELGLSPDLINAVTDAGYTIPTPIQAQAIPHVLAGRDVLGVAQTGTGKTASFTLPMIDILATGRARARMPRTLILEPTRELAAQVSQAFETYGKYNKLSMALLIGGESFSDQERKLDRGVDVLIATPGRLMDLFDRGKILLSDAKILVIDEADRMLDMGFIPDIERIVSLLPKIRQTLFFSATMPNEIRRLADAFLSNPKEITVSPPASPSLSVTQSVSLLWAEDKRNALRHLLRTEDVKNAIIFCNRKRDVDILWRSLQKHEFDALPLHGDMVQSKRTETLDKFRAGTVRLLVASDVAARGIDIQGLSHVFNFDVPIHAEDYVHRIGRTGRAGNIGRAFTFATPDEGRALTNIEKLIGKGIDRFTMNEFEAPEFADEDKPRRGRQGQRSERKSSSDRPSRDRSAREPKVEVAAVPAEAAPPPRARPPEKREPRRERSRERTREDVNPIVMGERGVSATAERRPTTDRYRSNSRDDDEQVIGFGDHLPAFLKHPVRFNLSRSS